MAKGRVGGVETERTGCFRQRCQQEQWQGENRRRALGLRVQGGWQQGRRYRGTEHTRARSLLLCKEAEELELYPNRLPNWERKQDVHACFQSHQFVFAENL